MPADTADADYMLTSAFDIRIMYENEEAFVWLMVVPFVAPGWIAPGWIAPGWIARAKARGYQLRCW